MQQKIIIDNLLFELKILSDLNFQRRVWGGIKAEGWEKFSSWSEHMCRLYDDCFFENFVGKDWTNYDFSDALHAILKDLNGCLNKYNNKNKSDMEIINDSEWIRITKIARKAYNIMKKELEVEKNG